MTVAQTMKKINSRIPGLLPPPPKTEIDGKITDLSSKTVAELLELKDRQLKILNNKAFAAKLPDKGAKIQAFYDKIVAQLKLKQEEETACQMLEKLSLKQTIEKVEWEGKLDKKSTTYLDSDDDSEPEDVLYILSQSTTQEKKVKILQPDKSLITPDDILKVGDVPHIKYIVEKTETNQKPKTNQYKPYKTTKSDVHNPEKEIDRKKHKNWEITAATPPPIIHGPAKVLTLGESLKLQKEHNLHLKEVEAQHAAEKLLSRMEVKMATLPNDGSKFGKYREVGSDSDDSDPEGSDKEVHDEEPERGGVIFTVMN